MPPPPGMFEVILLSYIKINSLMLCSITNHNPRNFTLNFLFLFLLFWTMKCLPFIHRVIVGRILNKQLTNYVLFNYQNKLIWYGFFFVVVHFILFVCMFVCFETESKAGFELPEKDDLELPTLLPLPPKCWGGITGLNQHDWLSIWWMLMASFS